MSCNCDHTTDEKKLSCPCDGFTHPLPLRIGMGLMDIPRQIATFNEFRRAMLFDVRSKPALQEWVARQPDDLGLLLLEMWAYICHSLTFYDKVIAQEEYLRTALRRPSLRRLVALLGYLPRPAIASTVFLAAEAEGRLRLKLPAGTAFRSAAFEGNPPQVFELTSDAFIHPLANSWKIPAPVPQGTLSANINWFLVQPSLEIKAGNPAFLLDSSSNYNTGLWINSVDTYTETDGKISRKIVFENSTNLPVNYPLSELKLFSPLQSTGLWKMNTDVTSPSVTSDHAYGVIILDSLQRHIKAGDYILLRRNHESRWFAIISVGEVNRMQNAGDDVIVNGNRFTMPGISVPVTKLVLDVRVNDRKKPGTADWTNNDREVLIVHFVMQPAGIIHNEPKTLLVSTDPLKLSPPVEMPVDAYEPSSFLLKDKNLHGVKINGSIDYAAPRIQYTGDNWKETLTLPVQAYGNVIHTSRGETVPSEILGSGDASTSNQVFKLKKKPLTYLPAPTANNDQGIQNALRVFVNGIRWTEVAGFYNKKPLEEIYIVRQNDDGDSLIVFGDGIRGKRLPTGTDNITATYRYGAGVSAPPAGTVNQIAKPVKGLQSVNNFLAAAGGDDATTSEGLRLHAPKSVLILGRAISIPDMEAVTLSIPGVRAAQVEWRWNGTRQTAVVQIWYIGEEAIEDTIVARLANITDPSVEIDVRRAEPEVVQLSIDVKIDPRYVAENVLKEVKTVFIDSEKALLKPENLGIGKPLFLSRIFEAAIQVEGVLAVRNVQWFNAAFTEFGKKPGAGHYYDFIQGLEINGNN